MAQVNVELNQTQSRILARAVYTDITSYIKAHPEEYQNYIKECEELRTNETKSTH